MDIKSKKTRQNEHEIEKSTQFRVQRHETRRIGAKRHDFEDSSMIIEAQRNRPNASPFSSHIYALSNTIRIT